MAEAEPYDFPRNIRHIQAIQIRNLTPFPVRDTVTSTLNQRSTPGNGIQDDLDLTFKSKRGRKHSNATVGSLDDDHPGHSPTSRKRSSSIASRISNASSRKSIISVRPPRQRTVSADVLLAQPHPLFDTSQTGLEKVIRSRLVETFLSITVVEPLKKTAAPKRKVVPKTGEQRRGSIGSFTSPVSPNGSSVVVPKAKHTKTLSSVVSSRAGTPPASPTPTPRSPTFKSKALTFPIESGPSSPTFSKDQRSISTSTLTPNYLSSIHSPSTNPLFSLEPTRPGGSRFAPWTNGTIRFLHVEIWGKHVSNDERTSFSNAKGKEPLRYPHNSVLEGDEWKVLEQWNVDLTALQPVPKELKDHPSSIPCNTLLVHLVGGRMLYLPRPIVPTSKSEPIARPPQDSGYSSDPELPNRLDIPETTHGVSRRRNRKRRPPDIQLDAGFDDRTRSNSPEPDVLATSASWSDLFKLVTLQASVADYQSAVRDIVASTDKVLEADTITPFKREISQREFELSELRRARDDVVQDTFQVRQQIAARRAELEERRAILAEAQAIPRELSDIQQEIEDEEAKLRSLRSHFAPVRQALFAHLLSIYPIDLLSPPDLLYTILSVPLPIPINPQDPAPPLILPKIQLDPSDESTFDAQNVFNSKMIMDEEKVATALGYAGHVVQLLATYLGMGLVYPVTYVGSRTLIRDGISAMVGPRMFPLFSKGVDTYRFEYAVFLLNKDIELLMSDRDLRAMDIRQTLPNLKNLLLTLSGDAVPGKVPRRRLSDLSLGSTNGLASPGSEQSDPLSSEEDYSSTSSRKSGTTTPTDDKPVSTTASFFSGFGGFLRRAPSTGTVKAPIDDDEEDEERRTLRGAEGTISVGGGTEAVVLAGNGYAHPKEAEKIAGNGEVPNRTASH
ncbi:hypothetical protein DL96DRAFT_1572017 [Flagelloscypha sp. PMI_526]|nr:hypothetical protein DL96DRAFT_1572017 [Flagelloscypha sp. PMI_526]